MEGGVDVVVDSTVALASSSRITKFDFRLVRLKKRIQRAPKTRTARAIKKTISRRSRLYYPNPS